MKRITLTLIPLLFPVSFKLMSQDYDPSWSTQLREGYFSAATLSGFLSQYNYGDTKLFGTR